MKVELAYGEGYLPIELPEEQTMVIEPSFVPGQADEKGAVLSALRNPIGAPALRDTVRVTDKVCIVFTDITRATPNDRLIPWLLEELSFIPRENITLLNSLGTHRPNTREELNKLLTQEVVDNYRVLNHEGENPSELKEFGVTR